MKSEKSRLIKDADKWQAYIEHGQDLNGHLQEEVPEITEADWDDLHKLDEFRKQHPFEPRLQVGNWTNEFEQLAPYQPRKRRR